MLRPLDGSLAIWTEVTGPVRSRLLRLLLDTGSGSVVISREAATDIGFDLDHSEDTMRLVSASGVVEAPVFTASIVTTEDVAVDNVRVSAHDLPSEVSVEIDGLLGMSFLEHTIFTFDFKAKTFTMMDP